MSYRAEKQVLTAHTDEWTHRQTDAGNDNTRRPKLASGKDGKTPGTDGLNVEFYTFFFFFFWGGGGGGVDLM